MNKETKTLFITVAVALGLLWFFKPKGTKLSKTLDGSKYKEPKLASDDLKKAKEDAVVGLQAMRDAIDANEPKRELDKLNSIILQDFGVKVMGNKKTGKLRAMSKDGKVLAEEK
jgi:hypothetical protein